ncbi:hypothetical protein CYMTET_49830 [Cymbomonas tetramitiformis]|uniref:Uncharacterized protein n=1 Tax=Cymbomonas tetramitiformis TaxID=36881 RepID=A0AAE0BRE5_9CHLO|nr:hypothetical protein CYMTET_49830 [Cymbomonas tetramitiformis]|eukprot:gene13986-16531_t
MALTAKSLRRSIDEQTLNSLIPVQSVNPKAQAYIPSAKSYAASTWKPSRRSGEFSRRRSLDVSLETPSTVPEHSETTGDNEWSVSTGSEVSWASFSTIAPMHIGLPLEPTSVSPVSVEHALPSPDFVFVHPTKALEFTSEGAVRVTPGASMRSILPGGTDDYYVHHFAKAALAVRKDSSVPYCSFSTSDSVTVVYGAIENVGYLQRKHGFGADCSDSEVIYKLYEKSKFSFLGSLRGKFTVIHYSEAEDQAFAATDISRSHCVMQGQDATGGLLISDTDLGNEFSLSEVPAASFIFGKYRDRDVHKYAASQSELEASKEVAAAAVDRALSGLPKLPPRGAKGRSDAGSSWRRTSSSQSVGHSDAIENRRTKLGRADLAGSWRR